MHLDRPAYSYRSDTTIPEFSDDGPRTVMDAKCSICAKGAQWIAHNDKKKHFKIIPMQSPLGEALLNHYGMDAKDPLSWLYINEGKASASLDAVMATGYALGGVWRGLAILYLLPRGARDWLYGLVARNRYRFNGKTMICNIVDDAVRERIIE